MAEETTVGQAGVDSESPRLRPRQPSEQAYLYQQFMQQQRAGLTQRRAAHADNAIPRVASGQRRLLSEEDFDELETDDDAIRSMLSRRDHTRGGIADPFADEADAYQSAKATPPSSLYKDDPAPTPKSSSDDWRAKCAQRCDERMMDVTGVGVQAIATSMAEVRATIEYRRIVNTTKHYVLEGEAPDQELTKLITQVQTEVSRRAAAVVEYLQVRTTQTRESDIAFLVATAN